MKMDESFDGCRSFEEDWNSFDFVSVPDRDDLSRTVTEVQALNHEGQALLIAGRGPTDGVDDYESSHGTGKGRAFSFSALVTNRETQTIHENPRDSVATANPVLVVETPQEATAEEMMWLRSMAPYIKALSTQKEANENISRTLSSQMKELEPPKNVQGRDVMAPSASAKVPSYVEMKPSFLSIDDTDSVQQYCCIGTSRQGRDCKDTNERGCNFCRSHLKQTEAAAAGTKIDSLPVATLVQCVAVSKAGTRCSNAARKRAAHCGKHLPKREALIENTSHQRRVFSTRGDRCEKAAKKGYIFCGGRHLPSTTVAKKQAISSKAMMLYGRNAMPPAAIPATKTIVMCVDPSCRDMAKKGLLYCRQHSSLPAIPVLVANNGAAHCVAITKAGKQRGDPPIVVTSYCVKNYPPRSTSMCTAVTKTGKRCVDSTVGGTLFCYNHRHLLATSLVVKMRKAPPPRTVPVQSDAVNIGGQRLAVGGRATASAGRSRRCQGLTEVGKRCKDTAKKNSLLCGRHSTGTNPIGTEDVMMSQLIGYVDGRLSSMKHPK